MDNLEKFIKDNKEEFNLETPNPKVWKGIEEERKEKDVKVRKLIPWKTMRVAASILVLALAVYGGYSLFKPTASLDTNVATSQLEEIDNYYEAQVAAHLVKVEAVVDDQDVLNSIYNDLEELNKEKQDLYNEYGDDLHDQQVVEALINTYRMKLDVLENILSIISENEESNELSI